MKHLRTSLLIVPCLALAISCASLNRISYDSFGAVATTVEAARRAFVDYENTGAVTQAQHDQVQVIYVKYQQSMQVAKGVQKSLADAHSEDLSLLQTALNVAVDNAGAVVEYVRSLLTPDKANALKKVKPVKATLES